MDDVLKDTQNTLLFAFNQHKPSSLCASFEFTLWPMVIPELFLQGISSYDRPTHELE